MKENKKLKELMAFIIAATVCLSPLAVVPTASADCPYDCSDGMVSYWELNETVAGPVVDCYGSNDGTNNGAIINQPGQVATAYNFDGVDDYVDCGDVSELNSTSAFTICGWYKDINIGGHNRHFSKYNGGEYDISAATYSNRLYLEVGNGANTFAYWTGYSSTISSGEWYHAAFVFDGSGSTNEDKVKIYVNGVERSLIYSGTMPSTTADLSSHPFTISKSSTSWDGTIDEVAIYNRALSPSEVSIHYHAGLAGHGYCDPPTTAMYCFAVNYMSVIDKKKCGAKRDKIQIGGSLKLADGALSFDPELDDVSVTINGDEITIGPGLFDKKNFLRLEYYRFRGNIDDVWVQMNLNFDTCRWSVNLYGKDASDLVDSESVSIRLNIGSNSGSDDLEWSRNWKRRWIAIAKFIEWPPIRCCHRGCW